MSSLGIRFALPYVGGNGIIINNGVVSIANNLSIESLKLNEDGAFSGNVLEVYANTNQLAIALYNLVDAIFSLQITTVPSVVLSDVADNLLEIDSDVIQLKNTGTLTDQLGNGLITQKIQTIANNANAPIISFDTANPGTPTPFLNSSIDILIDGNSVNLPYSDL